MTRTALVLALVPLAACQVDIHFHESHDAARARGCAAECAVEIEDSTEGVEASSVEDDAVAGIVRDLEGRPVRAQVAAVGDSGSMSRSTDDAGRFELEGLHWKEFVLHASTGDGRLAVRSGVRPGTGGVDLVVRPGATIVVDVRGVENVRCAVFHDHARIEDFTLRAGKPSRVVVPAGEVRVRLYEGDKVHAEKTVRLDVGEVEDLGFDLGGK